MNQLLMFIGTTMLITILIAMFFPDYENYKRKIEYTSKNYYDYVWLLSFLISFMINCLVWGLIW